MKQGAGDEAVAAPSVKAMFGRTPRAQVEQALGRAIADLPPEDALITQMHFRDGMSAHDVAWILRLDPVDTTQRAGGIQIRFRGMLSRYDASPQDVRSLLVTPAVWQFVHAVPRIPLDSSASGATVPGDRSSVVQAWLGDEASYTERPLLLSVLLSDHDQYDTFMRAAREKLARRPTTIPDTVGGAARSSRIQYLAGAVILIVVGGVLLRYFLGR
jgi:hypothetical protein